MALVSLEYVEEVMRDKGFHNWYVYQDDRTVNRQEGLKLEDSIARLKKCVRSVQAGILEVRITNKTGEETRAGGNTRGNYLTYEVLAGDGKQPTEINGHSDANNDTIAALNKRIAQLEYENEIKALKEEIAALKEEMEEAPEPVNGIGAVVEQVTPYIPALLGKILGINIPPTVSGMNGHEETEGTKVETQNTTLTPEQVEQIKKCSSAAKRILAVDRNFGDRMLLLAILAEKDVESYTMACTMLNSMAEKLK